MKNFRVLDLRICPAGIFFEAGTTPVQMPGSIRRIISKSHTDVQERREWAMFCI